MCSKTININKVKEQSKFFLGKHDLSAFRSINCQSKSAIKSINSIDVKKKTKLQNNIFAKSLNINKNNADPEEIILTQRLVLECLCYRRAENYEDWINLGWVLRNIDYRLLDTWIEFSKISTAYVEGECQTIWNKMRKDNMGLGTLRWWAKLDNNAKYDEIINESLFPWIDRCIRSDGAHFDVARVVQNLKKDDIALGIDEFGKSAPYKEIYEHMNLTSNKIVSIIQKKLRK